MFFDKCYGGPGSTWRPFRYHSMILRWCPHINEGNPHSNFEVNSFTLLVMVIMTFEKAFLTGRNIIYYETLLIYSRSSLKENQRMLCLYFFDEQI